MKKKTIALMLGMVLTFSVTTAGCGNAAETKNADTTAQTQDAAEPQTTDTAAEAPAVTVDDAAEEAAEAVTVDTEAEDFTLLDVTADMVDQGLYAVDEAGNELVVTLFTAPDETPMISMFVFGADGAGDVICGEYGDNVTVETDEDNVDWTTFSITDVYTGTDMTIICAEGDDGSVYITDESGTAVYEAQYLTADETIDYMGAAVSMMSE